MACVKRASPSPGWGSTSRASSPDGDQPGATIVQRISALAGAMTGVCAASGQLAGALTSRLTGTPVDVMAQQYQVALCEVEAEGKREAVQLVENVSCLWEREVDADNNPDQPTASRRSVQTLLLALQAQYHFFHFAAERLARFAHAQNPAEQTTGTAAAVPKSAATPPPVPARPACDQARRSPANSPIESPANSTKPMEPPANRPKPMESPANSPMPMESPANSPKPMESPANSPQLVESPANSHKLVDSPANSPKPMDSPANSPKPMDSPANSPKPMDSPANSPKPMDSPANSPNSMESPAKSQISVQAPSTGQTFAQSTSGFRKQISLLFSRLGTKSGHTGAPRSSFFVELTEAEPSGGATEPCSGAGPNLEHPTPRSKRISSHAVVGASEEELNTVIDLLSGVCRPPLPAPALGPHCPPPSFPPPPLPQHRVSRAVGSHRHSTSSVHPPPSHPPPSHPSLTPPGTHSYRGLRCEQRRRADIPPLTTAKTNTWPSKFSEQRTGGAAGGGATSSAAGILLVGGSWPWSAGRTDGMDRMDGWTCCNERQLYGSQQWSTAADSSSGGSDASSSSHDPPWASAYSHTGHWDNQSEEIMSVSAEDHPSLAGGASWNVKNLWNSGVVGHGWGANVQGGGDQRVTPVSPPGPPAGPWGVDLIPHPPPPPHLD